MRKTRYFYMERERVERRARRAIGPRGPSSSMNPYLFQGISAKDRMRCVRRIVFMEVTPFTIFSFQLSHLL